MNKKDLTHFAARPQQIQIRFTKRFLIILGALLMVFNTANISFAKTGNILVYGDSLSAAYGMELNQGWVQLLSAKLGDQYAISNASISGETTVGGLSRLPETLRQLQPNLLLLELGANDGLRGYPISKIRENISKMVLIAQQEEIAVVVTGISLPANRGPRYIDEFRALFKDVAQQQKVAFIDLYREDFVTTPGMIQSDGLHPTQDAQPLIANMVYEFLADSKLIIPAQL